MLNSDFRFGWAQVAAARLGVTASNLRDRRGFRSVRRLRQDFDCVDQGVVDYRYEREFDLPLIQGNRMILGVTLQSGLN